jgi:hypothetical protein
MVKKGPIGKVEAFYIQAHYEIMPSQEIAKDLNRNLKSVESYISKIIQDNVKKNEENGLKAGDQFQHNKGATIMTENASTIADANRKVGPRLNNSCITRIK